MSEETENPPIDRTARKRSHILKRMWDGAKSGLMWGGIGGIGLTAVGSMFAFSLGSGAVGAGVGIAKVLGSIPILGPVLLGGLAMFGIGTGAEAVASAGGAVNAMTGLIGTVVTGLLTAALPIVGISLAVGGAVGAVWGGISGAMELDDVDKQVDSEIQRKKDLSLRNSREEKIMAQRYEQNLQEMDRQGQAAGFAPVSGLPANAMAKNEPKSKGWGGIFG